MDLMEKIVSLAKRRGFVFPGSEIYGGLSNSWDFGPVGTELKKNIKDLWWNTFVRGREDVVGIDAAIIMNPKVWEASGHVSGFSDPLRECKKCHLRYRPDLIQELLDATSEKVASIHHILGLIDQVKNCSKGGKHEWSEVKQFNLMLKTSLGAAEDSSSFAYLRPETAQGMFVDFKSVLSSTHKKLPLGVAQMGKAFRNEITTGNFLFRLRELEQMEIEYFIPKPKTDKDWQAHFEHWRKEIWRWFDLSGINRKQVHEREIPDGDRAHYSKRTIDFEFDYPFGQKELYGLAYRTDYDLTQHEKYSGQDLSYLDQETGEKYIPHVIEPTWGVDRTFLAVLLSAYHEEPGRVILRLNPKIAPYTVAVFPLVRNKPEITEKAKQVFAMLRLSLRSAWDDRGNIGKRYYAQDEIGTPWCVTIDYDTLENDTVTVRDRDSAVQERVAIPKLIQYIEKKLH